MSIPKSRLPALPPPQPAATYAQAERAFARLAALDDDTILPDGGSRLWSHGARVDRACVLFHGFTNCPLQYAAFGAQLYARGYNVVAPRFPGHGDRNRKPDRLARVPAAAFLATAEQALDIACGLGERVSVLGISSGGALAAILALERPDVARAICIAPLFGLLKLPHAADVAAAALLSVIPNVDLAWDPSGKNDEIPAYGYTHFPTKTLGELLGLGLDVAGTLTTPRGGEAVIVTNDRDPAVSNPLAIEAGHRWNRHRPGFASFYEFTDLPANHDIIDPTDSRQRTAEVYPVLIDLLQRA